MIDILDHDREAVAGGYCWLVYVIDSAAAMLLGTYVPSSISASCYS